MQPGPKLGEGKSETSTKLEGSNDAKASEGTTNELDFLNSLIKNIAPRSEKFSFSEKTKGTPYNNYRLMLRPEAVDLAREIARCFSDFGVNAQLQFKGSHPLCIIDCTTVKILNDVKPVQKIILALDAAKTAAKYCEEGELCKANGDLDGALAFFQGAVKLGSKQAVKDVERVNTKIAAEAMKKGFGPGLTGIVSQPSQDSDKNEQPDAVPMEVNKIQQPK